jgi:hypothetical protein
MTIQAESVRCTGFIDFRVIFVPQYRYVSRRWKPRG